MNYIFMITGGIVLIVALQFFFAKSDHYSYFDGWKVLNVHMEAKTTVIFEDIWEIKKYKHFIILKEGRETKKVEIPKELYDNYERLLLEGESNIRFKHKLDSSQIN